METVAVEGAAWEHYVGTYERLIGDPRTRRTCSGDHRGERLRTAVIARFPPELAAVKHGEQRVRRLVMNESTQRSQLDAEHPLIVRSLGAFSITRLCYPGRAALARSILFVYLIPGSLLFIPL